MVAITHILLGLKVGGLERVVVNLVRGLQTRGFQNTVICLEEGGAFACELQQSGISVQVLGKSPGMSWSTVRQLAGRLRDHRTQIVHSHNPAPHFHAVLAGLLAGVPVRVHTKHGRNYPRNHRRVWLNHVLSWFTDVIVPVSDNAGDVAARIERVNPRKLCRIWNGVDTELYQPRTAHRAPRTATIGTVARLSPEKDQQTMLAAFKLVLAQLPDCRLVFAGDGPCATELRETATRLGIADHVDFLGNRTDIPAVLNSFDIFTLSSTTEGISMTILEAMACGIPVVATDVGGNREIVNPPECGLIVPPRNPQALADAYLNLLRNPTTATEMGRAARQRVIDHFSLKTMVDEYQALYEQLLSRKGVTA